MVVVGSQAILATWPEAPASLRTSLEIDAYPENAREWEARNRQEASEEINAHFGYLSQFHDTHGFYVDGVDETTATLPSDWRMRQVVTPIESDGKRIFAITPSITDLVNPSSAVSRKKTSNMPKRFMRSAGWSPIVCWS